MKQGDAFDPSVWRHPCVMLDGQNPVWVRLKYVSGGVAYFEQFGEERLIERTTRTYGYAWQLIEGNEYISTQARKGGADDTVQ